MTLSVLRSQIVIVGLRGLKKLQTQRIKHIRKQMQKADNGYGYTVQQNKF